MDTETTQANNTNVVWETQQVLGQQKWVVIKYAGRSQLSVCRNQCMEHRPLPCPPKDK